ncbi:biosynthetic peptidoglycan transglycosylase [uncultured Methylobacterium sp.]|nr:biosynthetic peptidoglycan transglycosylase [uncultured Methylobacterium sp.]
MRRPIEWPSMRRFLLDVHADLLAIHNKTSVVIDFGRLNSTEKLILILEDRRFFKHFGVDIVSIIRETTKAMLFRRHGGASTIDMQWVRTVTEYREHTFGRKIYEMFLALIIQQRYDKMTIFRSYLQIAYLGHRIKGIDEASEKVFGKPVMHLSLDEAAEIAAMFVYPRPSVPTPRWLFKLERRKNYAKQLYPRYEKRFDKLPSRKIL